MKKEIDYKDTFNIVCPYCGYEYLDSSSAADSDDDHECGQCCRHFSYEREVTVTYTSYKKDGERTPEETEMKMEYNIHTIDDKDCKECWMGYPKACECGGLVHAEFYDEEDDTPVLSYKCDKCGAEYCIKG